MMWSKTFVGLFLGLILSMSLFVSIGYFVPMQRDVLLFGGYVGIFILWTALMTWVYCSHSVKRPLFLCLGLLTVSSVANAARYMGAI